MLAFIFASCGDGEKINIIPQSKLNSEIESLSRRKDSQYSDYFTLPAGVTPITQQTLRALYPGQSGQKLNFIEIDSPDFDQPFYNDGYTSYYFPVTANGATITISRLPEGSTAIADYIFKIRSVTMTEGRETRVYTPAEMDEAGVTDQGYSKFKVVFAQNPSHFERSLVIYAETDERYPAEGNITKPLTQTIYLMQLPYANTFDFNMLKIKNTETSPIN